MNLTIRADIGDGPFEVTTSMWSIVAWERKYKAKVSNMASAMGMEDLAYLAYESAKVAKIVVPAVFDDFVKRLQLLEVVSEEAVHPTEAAPTGEN